MASLSVFAPAKLNLYLAITGARADGFHELVSLVTPLELGDVLEVEPQSAGRGDTLRCDHPGVPTDGTNLVLKAAAAYRQRAGAGSVPPVEFTLAKETPAGAGLGGGSSDAAAALRALNQLAQQPLSEAALRACAAEVGSDVPLFLEKGPVVMRGRGEVVEPLGKAAVRALEGRPVLVFKPPFGVATAWAYRRLKDRAPAWYKGAAAAEAQLQGWLERPTWESLPLENTLEQPVFEKHAALPALLNELRREFGLRCAMSGSGSACFALVEPRHSVAAVEQAIRSAWGPECFVRATRLRGGR